MPTKIQLLGRFAVERDGQEIALRDFHGRLARRLLRLLALRRGTLVPKDLIADALWPEDPPADARGNVEVLVSRLRRALGDRTLIRTGPAGYALADGDQCWVDAEAFVAAVQAGRAALATRPAAALGSFRTALRIWRGEPLPEDTYADWAQADRHRLWLAYLEALDGAAAAALGSTDTAVMAEAASWARQAVTAEPLRESSVLLLVQALAAAGNQAGALAAFDQYRDRLGAETGLDPTARALEIRQRILAGQPACPQPGHGRAVQPAQPPGRTGLFLGREDECGVIAEAAAGHGIRAVLVAGPGGSALVDEAARQADIPVLRAQALPPDQDVAWSLAGRLLGQARGRLPGSPTIPAGQHHGATAPGGAPGLIAAAARPRCLVVADDLQWADQASITLLSLLLRDHDNVTVIATYRPGSHGFDPAAALGLAAAQLTSFILGPLPTCVITVQFSDPLLAETVLGRTSRAPFTATEAITALTRQDASDRGDDHLPGLLPGRGITGTARNATAGIEHAAGNRLAGLPFRWREMLGLLATLGSPAVPTLLAAASGTDLRTALDTLEGLGSAGLASSGPRGWALSPELAGQALSTAFGRNEIARFHALLAAALRQHGTDPGEAAAHLAASGDNNGAAAAYADAARHMLERIRDREAVRLAETGLSLDPAPHTRAALLEVRGEVRRRRGQLTAARTDFTDALDNFGDPAARSRVMSQLAILEARTADAARGGELADFAIAEAGDQPAALGQALAAGAIIDLSQGSLSRARYRIRRAAQQLDRAGDSRGSARLLYLRAMTCLIDGRLDDAVIQLDRLTRLLVTPDEVLRLWSPRATRGHALALLGRAGEGLAEIDEALDGARAVRHRAVETECLWRRSEVLAILGRAAEAMESAAESARIATLIRHAEWTAAAHRGLGVACAAAGQPDRAESAYRRSLLAAENIPFFRAWAAARLGAFLAHQGRDREAAPHVRAALTTQIPLIRHEARWAHAELLASQGKDEECRAAAVIATEAAEGDGYLVLVPRLRELAGLDSPGRGAIDGGYSRY